MQKRLTVNYPLNEHEPYNPFMALLPPFESNHIEFDSNLSQKKPGFKIDAGLHE